MEKRRLAELRVVDLRVELEKRGLDKNGVKAALVERLAQALSNEGYDPETYVFDTTDATAPKRASVGKRQRKPKEEGGEPEGEDDEDEAESGDSVPHESTDAHHETSAVDDKNVVTATQPAPMESVDDTSLFKIPNQESRIPSPDMVEPQCPFTVEDTIRLHTNRQLGADDSSSLFVNTDDGGGSEADQSENDTDADKSSVKNEPMDENDVTPQLATNDLTETSTEVKAEPMESDDPPAPNDAASATAEGKTADDDAQRNDDTKPATEKAKADAQAAADKAEKLSKGKDLWISGLASNTRAAELKALFSKYGRVAVAKIVQSTKSQGSKCYGIVAMATPEEASKCIQHLHRTELHGRVITVERAKSDQFTLNAAKKDAPTAGPLAGVAVSVKKPTPANNIVAQALKVEGGKDDAQQAATTVPAEPKLETENKDTTKATNQGEKKSADGKQLKKQSSKDKASTDTKPKEKQKSRSRSPRRSGDSRDRHSRTTHRPTVTRVGGTHRPTRPAVHRPVLSRPPPPRPPPSQSRTFYERSLARAAMVRARADDLRREREKRERERERERLRQREIDERLRQKEMEFRQREEKLRLAKEIERLKYEREKLERERLELQQMRMQTAYARDRMPPPVAPVVTGVKRPYDNVPSSYTPEAKRGNYASASGSSGYGSRSSGRERSSPRRESYGSRDNSRSGTRYSSDTGRSSDRHQPSRSGNHHREEDYRSRRPESGSRSSIPSRSSTSSRRVPSPPRRSRDAPPPPPPPPPRGGPVWSSGSSNRHTSSSSRDRDGNYSSTRLSGSGSANYGTSNRSFPQQSSSTHGTAPWQTAASLSGMQTVGAWARPGPTATVGQNVWSNMPSNVFPNAMTGATGSSNYSASTDRFDTYGKTYSGSAGRRY